VQHAALRFPAVRRDAIGDPATRTQPYGPAVASRFLPPRASRASLSSCSRGLVLGVMRSNGRLVAAGSWEWFRYDAALGRRGRRCSRLGGGGSRAWVDHRLLVGGGDLRRGRHGLRPASAPPRSLSRTRDRARSGVTPRAQSPDHVGGMAEDRAGRLDAAAGGLPHFDFPEAVRHRMGSPDDRSGEALARMPVPRAMQDCGPRRASPPPRQERDRRVQARLRRRRVPCSPRIGGLNSGAGRVSRRVGSREVARAVDRLFLIPAGPRTGPPYVHRSV
jgi:hypothetical protein